MRLIVFAVVLLLTVPAEARNEASIKAYASALFSNMSLHWSCREHLGLPAYQASKTMAVNGLSAYVGASEAKTSVDTMDQRFRNDTRTVPATSARCKELQTQRLHDIAVEKAKLDAE